MSKIRLIITSIISIVLVSILLIGSTYSIFTTTEIDEELNVYKTGDLNISYKSNNIKITDITPMNEEEADGITPHRVTVTNNGNVPYMFDLILTDTTSSETNTIDYQYIMTKVGYLTPKKLSNCTNNIIKEDIILLPGKSIDIDVRIWLSDNISNSEIGKSFYAKLSVDGQAVYIDSKEINNDILSLRYMKSSSTSDFRNDTYRTYIKTASFVDYIDTSNATIDTTTNEKIMWDMTTSTTHNTNKVIAWLEDNGDLDENGNKLYDLYIGSEQKIYASSLEGFFFDMTTLENISFDNLDTSLTKNMRSFVFGCSSLTELDLSNFDTSNVVTMGYNSRTGMFQGCSSLTELDLSSFNTSKVTEMVGMFQNCSSLTSLDLSSFDTNSVTKMSYMFSGNNNLSSLNLSGWDTSQVTNMELMFSGCSSLTSLDVSSFVTSNVTNMSLMFRDCSKLTSLDVSSFVTSNVTNMNLMFEGCSSLTSLDLSSFDTSEVSNMQQMFEGCSSLISLDVSNFNTSGVTTMAQMFRDCTNLTELDVSNFDTSQVTTMSGMFYNCPKLSNLVLFEFNPIGSLNVSSMFYECYVLKTEIKILNNNITSYGNVFLWAATNKDSEGKYIGEITINYIPDNPNTDTNESTEAIVDAMIATGNGNIVKGCYGTNCPVEEETT